MTPTITGWPLFNSDNEKAVDKYGGRVKWGKQTSFLYLLKWQPSGVAQRSLNEPTDEWAFVRGCCQPGGWQAGWWEWELAGCPSPARWSDKQSHRSEERISHILPTGSFPLEGLPGNISGRSCPDMEVLKCTRSHLDKAAFHWGRGIIAVNCIELGECDRGIHYNTQSVV